MGDFFIVVVRLQSDDLPLKVFTDGAEAREFANQLTKDEIEGFVSRGINSGFCGSDDCHCVALLEIAGGAVRDWSTCHVQDVI